MSSAKISSTISYRASLQILLRYYLSFRVTLGIYMQKQSIKYDLYQRCASSSSMRSEPL